MFGALSRNGVLTTVDAGFCQSNEGDTLLYGMGLNADRLAVGSRALLSFGTYLGLTVLLAIVTIAWSSNRQRWTQPT